MGSTGWVKFASAVMVMTALVSCSTSKPDGLYAPEGRPLFAKDVDPMTVGHRLMAAGEYELALNAFARAAAEQGPTVDVLSALGSAQLGLGRLGQAESTLRRAISVDDSFVPAWNNLGVALMEQRKYAEAARVFETAFKIDNGQTAAIAENLRLALAKSNNSDYGSDTETNYKLLSRGTGEYVLVRTQ